MRRDLSFVALTWALSCVGCGDDDGGSVDAAIPAEDTGEDRDADASADASDDAPVTPDESDFAAAEPEPSMLIDGLVRREVITVEGETPPANPTTAEGTPAELNATTIVRYSVEGAEGPGAIVIGLPGLWGGAATMDVLARALVVRSSEAGAPIEVWAMDRRANALEDQRGMNAAHAAERPEIAERYYAGTATVGGESFSGFVRGQDLSFVSEWGLATHVGDLRRVIARVPEAQRRGRVFLMGHSLGAIIARAYAGWRFEDGTNGTDEIAGIVLIDGAPFYGSITEQQYREGPPGGLGGTPLTVSGLDAIRAGATIHASIPTTLLAQLQTYALRAFLSPEDVDVVPARDQLLKLQLGLDTASLPMMTNRAAYGFFMDDASNPLYIAAASLGAPDGETEDYPNALLGGTLSRPSDPDHLYDWISAEESGEATTLSDFAGSQFVSGVNLTEWYFPSRLLLDCVAVASTEIPEDGYQAEFGLRAFDQELIDAPVIAIATELATELNYENVKNAIAATVGEDRPGAGASRDEPAGYRVVSVPRFTHMDPVTGRDSEDNPVPGAILDFVRENAAP